MLQTIIYLMSPLPISLDVSYSYDNNLFVLVSFPLFYRLFVEKEIVTSVEMQYSEKIPLEFLRFFLRSGNNFWEVDWNNSPQEKSSKQIFVRDRNQIFVKQWNPRRVCRDGSEAVTILGSPLLVPPFLSRSSSKWYGWLIAALK